MRKIAGIRLLIGIMRRFLISAMLTEAASGRKEGIPIWRGY